MKWNEAQERAIFTRDKNILVSAAAGSGKTAVLTERIRQLVVQEGVSLDEMLIMTFTNAAAAELRERTHQSLTEAMEEEGADLRILQEQLDLLPGADICTFHSFCLKVIRSYFYLTDVTPDFRICDETQEEIYEQEAMDRMMTESFEKKDPEILEFLRKYADSRGEDRVRKMVHAIHRFLKSLPEPEEWLEKSLTAIRESENEQERETLPALLVLTEMVRRYDRVLREKKQSVKQLSFSDVEHIALQILRQEGPAEELREQYRCIFIDEYQDTSDLQETLVRLIRREDNVFMVGDVKQSIYQFRQADPSIFIEKYRSLREGSDPKGIKIDLNRNFRSKPNILDFVNEVMEPVMTEEAGGIVYDAAAKLYPGFDYAATPAADYPSMPVEIDVIEEKTVRERMIREGWNVSELKREELEAMQACRRIREVLGREYYDNKAKEVRRVSLSDIVVLMRSYRGAAQTWQEVFRRENIPAYVEGNDDYFETVEILVFTNLLKILVNRRQDIPLLSVLRSPIFGYTASELAAVRIHRKEGLFAESFLSYAEEGEEDVLREKCRNTLKKLDRWGEEAGYLSLKDLCWKAADESGYYEFAGALPRGSRRQENIRDLISRADKYQKDTGGNLAGFLKYIDRLAKTSAEVPARKPSGAGEEYVRLMSIHKSKGLEYPVVILAGAGKSFNHRKPAEELSLDKDLGIGLQYRDPANEYRIKTLRQLEIDETVKEKELAEEMRLLYVAMTRAREQLFIIGSVADGKASGKLGSLPPAEGKTYLDWIGYAVGSEPETPVRRMNVLTSLEEGGNAPLNLSAVSMPDGESAGEEEQLSMFDMPVSPAEEASGASSAGSADVSPEEEALREKVFRRMSFRYPYPEATEIPAKFTATELNRYYAEDLDELRETFGEELPVAPGVRVPKLRQELPAQNAGGERTFSAAERGTITHRVLQEIDLAHCSEEDDVKEQVRKMTEEGRLSGEEAKAVNPGWISRFFRSDLGRRMLQAQKVYREQEFLLWQPHDEETGSIVQGIIDCFFEDGDGLVLIDYKTDYIPAGDEEALQAKAEHYRRQLGIYRQAIEEARGVPVSECYLYFLSAGKAVRL